MGETLFQQCIGSLDNDRDLLNCISRRYHTASESNTAREQNITEWLFVLCGALVFFMQGGFAMVCAGSVRKKNLQNTMLKNILDACGAGFAFYAVGFAFAFGDIDVTNTFVGSVGFFGTERQQDIPLGFWFFQYSFSATAVTIVASTLAERSRMTAYLYCSVFLSAWVYPVIVHTIWSCNGVLSTCSATPFRGVGVIDLYVEHCSSDDPAHNSSS